MISDRLIANELDSSRTLSARHVLVPFPRGGAAAPLAPGYLLSRMRRSIKSSILQASVSKLVATAVLAIALLISPAPPATAKGDDFAAVVKLIEQFYHVKHQGIPFLARAGVKTATTVARIAGGPKRQLAEAGSVKVAYFEDQDFRSSQKPNNSFATFKNSMGAALAESWSPFVQVASAKDDEQTYIYLRDAGEKFNVMVVTIEPREACVVQVTLSPEALAKLIQNPDEMGKTITIDATADDN